MYIEKKSVLLALRSAIIPSLSGADAVMFATLLSEVFPTHDVPLIFDRKFQDNTEQRIANDTIGISLGNTDGEPLRSLPGSPLPKDQGIAGFYVLRSTSFSAVFCMQHMQHMTEKIFFFYCPDIKYRRRIIAVNSPSIFSCLSRPGLAVFHL